MEMVCLNHLDYTRKSIQNETNEWKRIFFKQAPVVLGQMDIKAPIVSELPGLFIFGDLASDSLSLDLTNKN